MGINLGVKMDLLKYFNDNYANAVAALTPFVIGFVSWLYYGVYKESQAKNAGVIYISPVFWGLRQNHRIDTVKRFEIVDDGKNYNELETLYTPMAWGRYIEVQRKFFRTRIVPKNHSDILAVTIKRRPHENWKIIYFNR